MNEIMIVDDNVYVRLSVEMICASVGLSLVSAESGEQCLRYLEGGFRGVILMDIMMPELDGWETIRAIIARNLYPGNVIVMLTGMEEPDDQMEGLQEYVTDYLTKPFGPDQLLGPLTYYLTLLEPGNLTHA